MRGCGEDPPRPFPLFCVSVGFMCICGRGGVVSVCGGGGGGGGGDEVMVWVVCVA